jgi:Helicase associated domain
MHYQQYLQSSNLSSIKMMNTSSNTQHQHPLLLFEDNYLDDLLHVLQTVEDVVQSPQSQQQQQQHGNNSLVGGFPSIMVPFPDPIRMGVSVGVGVVNANGNRQPSSLSQPQLQPQPQQSFLFPIKTATTCFASLSSSSSSSDSQSQSRRPCSFPKPLGKNSMTRKVTPMLDGGWCPPSISNQTELTSIESNNDSDSIFFASSTVPPPPSSSSRHHHHSHNLSMDGSLSSRIFDDDDDDDEEEKDQQDDDQQQRKQQQPPQQQEEQAGHYQDKIPEDELFSDSLFDDEDDDNNDDNNDHQDGYFYGDVVSDCGCNLDPLPSSVMTQLAAPPAAVPSSTIVSMSTSATSNNNNNNNSDTSTTLALSSMVSASASASSATTTTTSTTSPSCCFSGPSKARPHRYQSGPWNQRLEELRTFHQQHGHMLVPHVYKNNPPLSQWVKRQRYQYRLKRMGRHSTLSDDRERILTQMGFVWESHKQSWNESFQSLQIFYMTHGHCRVTKTNADETLNTWCKHQRRQYKRFVCGQSSHMTMERIQKLESLQFDWDPRNILALSAPAAAAAAAMRR